MTPIRLRNLRKSFGPVTAVAGVDLDIDAGQLFFLLGPSGCGKTTLLRMLAGFTEPSAGAIHFGDAEVTHLPPNQRNTGMVFQGYALWPHMTVAQNVAFGLDVRRIAPAEKKRRVEAALATVQMLDLAQRKPNELSGGQQQRVALARALVIEPTVLLLDEPLSNLDARLRLDMRAQIRDICKKASITAVYVTHDQKEALSMADRIAVMDAGRIVQTGPPREIYHRPVSRFVADFLGESNFIEGVIAERRGEQAVIDTAAGPMHCAAAPPNIAPGRRVTCSLRPEAVRIARDGPAIDGQNTFPARLAATTYLGELAQHQFILPGDLPLKVYELHPQPPDPAVPLKITFAPADLVILTG